MVLYGDDVKVKETQSNKHEYFESNSNYYLKDMKGNQVHTRSQLP